MILWMLSERASCTELAEIRQLRVALGLGRMEGSSRPKQGFGASEWNYGAKPSCPSLQVVSQWCPTNCAARGDVYRRMI